MADENLQEPTAEERAKFEQDLENVMKESAQAEQAQANNESAGEAPKQDSPANGEADGDKPAEEHTSDSAPKEEPKVSVEDTLKAELAASNDRYLRLMAEFDNFRRRSAREQLDIIETANAKLLEKLSEVLDNFERAFAAENKAKDLETFEKGMQLIHNQFQKLLTDAGLEQIDPTGAEFDPNCHEALMQQPSETVPEGHIVTVFQKGYKLKNKIIKTAKVIVSSGK